MGAFRRGKGLVNDSQQDGQPCEYPHAQSKGRFGPLLGKLILGRRYGDSRTISQTPLFKVNLKRSWSRLVRPCQNSKLDGMRR